MADFVSVLKRTIEGLGDTTPETRAKVYQKARATIDAKLAAMNPPPAPEVAARQRQALQAAIDEIEAGYAKPKPVDAFSDLDALFAELTGDTPAKPSQAATPLAQTVPPASPVTAAPRPAVSKQAAAAAAIAGASAVGAAGSSPAQAMTASASMPVAQPDAAPAPALPASARETLSQDVASDPGGDVVPTPRPVAMPQAIVPPLGGDDEVVSPAHVRRPSNARSGRRFSGGMLAAAIAVVVLAGGAYAAWINRDSFADLFATTNPAPEPTPALTVETESEPDVEAAPEPPQETAAADAEPEVTPEPPAVTPTPEVQKFTQRLNADGSETDEGPAGGSPTIGEGTSVAALSADQPGTAPAQDEGQAEMSTDIAEEQDDPATVAQAEDSQAEGAEAGGTAAPEAEAATPSVPVGQRAIFYEERTNVAQATADTGSIVWSVARESPGGDLPPEPAIRAEATIPGKDLQLRMTIRRNADETLPASHIIELIFLTPDDFAGGAIDNVLRMTLKDTEESAGNPVIGLPAKIADGFFLVALSDGAAEEEANTTLLRRQQWIDIPIVYRSGRRALMTMEKGVPGERVFEEVFRAWQSASSG